MNFPWFKRIGIFFIPASLIGWIILIFGFIFAVFSFMDIDGRSHSNSDTLMNFAFMLLIIGAVYTLIAYLTSRNARREE
jgi:dipeptide/tripeptide permease